MACVLRPGTGAEDFQAPVSVPVTLGLRVLSGAGAIVMIHYSDKSSDKEPPFQFKVESGTKHLAVLFAAIPPATLRLVELCGDGSERELETFDFNPKRPARGYFIKGT